MVRVAFERSGGFAGVTVRSVCDLAEPSAADTEAFRALRRLRGGRGAAPAEVGRDLFQYRLTVIDAGAEQVYVFSEADVPEPLRPLLDRLAALAEGREPPGAG